MFGSGTLVFSLMLTHKCNTTTSTSVNATSIRVVAKVTTLIEISEAFINVGARLNFCLTESW